MTRKEQLKKVLRNLESIEEIKLEDCKIYNEYSVVVLYQNDSDIIICNDSSDANMIYGYLTKELYKYKSNHNQLSPSETTLYR